MDRTVWHLRGTPDVLRAVMAIAETERMHLVDSDPSDGEIAVVHTRWAQEGTRSWLPPRVQMEAQRHGCTWEEAGLARDDEHARQVSRAMRGRR